MAPSFHTLLFLEIISHPALTCDCRNDIYVYHLTDDSQKKDQKINDYQVCAFDVKVHGYKEEKGTHLKRFAWTEPGFQEIRSEVAGVV